MPKNWLKLRSEILTKYAEALPTKQDRIQITFEYPDAGWMPVHFHKNGMDMGFIEFSDVYDCFEPLREWLETIATIGYEKAAILNLDCERWHAVLYYEPIWFYDYENHKGSIYPTNCGIFSVYDEAEDIFLLDAYCDTETFVRDVYKCIIDFAKAMKEKPEFIEDWVSFNWRHDTGIPDDDDPRMNEFFMNKVKSPSIQKFIRDCDSWHKNRNYFKRKERKACKAKQK